MFENYVSLPITAGMVQQPRTCPICGSPHDNFSGLAMHMVKMSDEDHSPFADCDDALQFLAYEGTLAGQSYSTDGCKGIV